MTTSVQIYMEDELRDRLSHIAAVNQLLREVTTELRGTVDSV
jgi:predicted transcriptional regulator